VPAAVVIENLSKSFKDVHAVRDVSLQVEEGQVFALLGPNGAGKSTTLEILEGFQKPDSGRVEVLGVDPADRAASAHLRQRLGIVLQDLTAQGPLKVREVLTQNAGYYPTARGVDEVIELVGLQEKADSRLAKLSGGQKRRLDLALGIIGNPDLLFLDEPTTGLDAQARRTSWGIVRDLAAQGTTIILTTHYIEEAEYLADHVAVISRGTIVASGTVDSLGGRDSGEAFIRFRLPAGMNPNELPLTIDEFANDFVVIRTRREVDDLRALISWGDARGVTIEALTVERPTLEDIYLRLTGGQAAHDEVEEELR
jgi:ABC-2 type transport system ATP-binding protein